MSDQATCHCRPESKVDLHAVEVPCGDVADALNKAFSRAIHDAWQQGYEQAVRDRKPRTITMAEELDELAEGSVILSNGGEDSAQKDGEGYWYLWGGDIGLCPEEVALPAIVLHDPDLLP